MKEIVWSREAAHDLENIKKHIAYDSPSYAVVHGSRDLSSFDNPTH